MKSRIKVHTEHTLYGDLGTPQYVDVLSSTDFQSYRTRQQDIQFRLLSELKSAENTDCSFHFVTLTYDDDNLPLVLQTNHFQKLGDPDEEGVRPCLDEYTEQLLINVARTRDLQNFNKRLRANISRHLNDSDQFTFKYLLCHEYGRADDYLDEFGKLRTATERAHYHGTYICSPAVPEDVFQKLVDESWCKGRTLCPVLSGDDIYQSIGYTSKYVSKDLTLTAPKFRPTHEDYTLVRSIYNDFDPETGSIGRELDLCEINPRVLTSKHLGACYVHENNDLSQPLREDLFLRGQHVLRLNSDNDSINIPLPRYYFKKYCKDNGYYVELNPETYNLADYEGVISRRDTFVERGNIRTKLNYYHSYSDGHLDLIKTKSVSSDSSFFKRFKSILADRNAVRNTQSFLDYFFSVPSYKELFKPDYFRIKEYFRNRFSLMPVVDYRPHSFPSKSRKRLYGMYGSFDLPMPLPVTRYALLQDIDPYYRQLEILIDAYEKTQESRRCARNSVRELEQRKRRQESHDKKLHRGKWRISRAV